MDYVYNIVSNVKYFYSSMNPAVLSGAIDVIVVEQPDGTYRSTPFHVRFGRYGVFNYDDKYVDVEINGMEIDLKMKLGENGVAFFVEANSDGECVPRYMATSPLPEDVQEERRKTLISAQSSAFLGSKSSTPTVRRLVKRRHSTANEKTVRRRVMKHKRIVLRKSGIYSGSYSDSETEKRAGSQAHHDTEWKWGEIPETKKEKEVKKLQKKIEQSSAKGNAYIWSWFGWPRRNTLSIASEVTNPKSTNGTDFNQPSTSAARDIAAVAKAHQSKDDVDEEKGLYLQDFSNDPTKFAEYFGKHSGPASISSNVDSGNGVSLGTSPSSPSALSLSDAVEADATAPSSSETIIGNSNRQRNEDSLTPTSENTPMMSAPLSVLEITQHKSGRISESLSSSTLNCEEEPDPTTSAVLHTAKTYPMAVTIATTAEVTSPSLGTTISMSSAAIMKDVSDGDKQDERPLISHSSQHTPTDEALLASNRAEALRQKAAIVSAGRRKDNRSSVPPILPSFSPSPDTLSSGCESPSKRRYNSGHSGAISSASDFGLSDEEMASVGMIASEYKRSLRLSSDQLRLLNLNYGSNEARFSITTKFQGTAWCSCHIYLIKWSEQLVVSDIDGTITKSDVLGHVIPAIGGTWAHAGVAELYTRIKANGYRMIYLSSRAIGMSGQTKSYLKTVRQGTRTLPDGPVLLSPTSVLMAFRKEVIERRPEEFKIACLSDLKNLFPNRQPYFAGFGNRITDVKSYRAVDIPFERILIINPSGMVTRGDGTRFCSDYAAMANGSVDFIFPPLLRSLAERRRREEAAAAAKALSAITVSSDTAASSTTELESLADSNNSDTNTIVALTAITQTSITKPEDIFPTSVVDAEHGAYYDGLVEDDVLADYAKRCAEAQNLRKISAGKK